ncbi:serine-rich adhesin for platelets-like [Planococcus citri]|uniref:serine-rich adhesin for platelets-like n=1 Tax=Planococcus citri TaxID=170843 RepID=UPI0031F89548
MVVTQLQLKWPNHSTHLLTRLTYLFKNEQLVDCTLMCNKHCLKVHRSVLAACSPYFERELQNNPSIVVKDMQFSVLKALIEFMYYGETRITEENLTSLIEAAKIFEVKGLSEMDIVSGKNGIVSSVVALENDCIVESSCLSDDTDKANFEAAQILQQSLAHSTAATSSSSMLDNNAISTTTTTTNNNNSTCNSNDTNPSITHCSESNNVDGSSIYENANGTDFMVESTSSPVLRDDQHQHQQSLHSSRNFVVTPPQTESAQILLSLARSHTQKMFTNHSTDDHDDGTLTNGNGSCAVDDEEETSNAENAFLNHDQYCGQDNVIAFDHQQQQQQQQQLQQRSINNSDVLFVEHNLILNDTCNGSSLISMASTGESESSSVVDASSAGGKSLLAKLLTRNNHEMDQASLKTSNGGRNATNAIMAADLQPSIILECPFLIETTDGAYVDVCMENMLNSLNGGGGGGEIQTSPATVAVSEQPLYEATSIGIADPSILERIKHEAAPELEDDPEAVVLTKISDDGRVEKYVLSSADVQALKQMNERLAAAKAASRPCSADVVTEFESLGAANDTPLITRVMVDGTGGIQNAINRLPFKRTVLDAPLASSGDPETSAQTGCIHDAILDDSLAVAVDDTRHHHENMFEELDNQFNTMDCAIDDEEHIRRDYVAYEEASKNETQLEHNYYANAMKDEDEESVAISGQYDLRMMMMIEETPPPAQSDIINQDTTTTTATSTSSTKPCSLTMKKRYQNVQLLGSSSSSATTTSSNSIADICLNGNTLVAFNPGKSTLSTAPSATLRINGGGVVSNIALADKPITVVPSNGSGAGKCDLIINDALMSSVLNVVPVTTVPTTAPAPTLLVKNTTPVSSSSSSTSTSATKRKVAAENHVLPFKSVKSANTFSKNSNSKKSATSTATKRTYNRRKNTSTEQNNQKQKIITPLNGAFSNENNLIEEIIVDEIS